MFNSYSYKQGDLTNEINTVSGTLVKTNSNSFFEYFSLGCNFAQNYVYGKQSQYILLQAMLTGDGYILAELIDRKEFEKEVQP